MATTLRLTETTLVAVAVTALWVASDGGVRTPSRQPAHAESARENYRCWADCIRLSNDRIDIVIVPAIGRVLRVGWRGGPNLLWETPDILGCRVGEPSQPEARHTVPSAHRDASSRAGGLVHEHSGERV